MKSGVPQGFLLPVHDHMDAEVQRDRDPRNRSVSDELGIAEKCGGAVVVSVKESKRFLLEDKEDSVDELEVLGQIIQLC